MEEGIGGGGEGGKGKSREIKNNQWNRRVQVKRRKTIREGAIEEGYKRVERGERDDEEEESDEENG